MVTFAQVRRLRHGRGENNGFDDLDVGIVEAMSGKRGDFICQSLLGTKNFGWFRNPVHSPVEVGSCFQHLQRVLHILGGAGAGFLPSTVVVWYFFVFVKSLCLGYPF